MLNNIKYSRILGALGGRREFLLCKMYAVSQVFRTFAPLFGVVCALYGCNVLSAR